MSHSSVSATLLYVTEVVVIEVPFWPPTATWSQRFEPVHVCDQENEEAPAPSSELAASNAGIEELLRHQRQAGDQRAIRHDDLNAQPPPAPGRDRASHPHLGRDRTPHLPAEAANAEPKLEGLPRAEREPHGHINARGRIRPRRRRGRRVSGNHRSHTHGRRARDVRLPLVLATGEHNWQRTDEPWHVNSCPVGREVIRHRLLRRDLQPGGRGRCVSGSKIYFVGRSAFAELVGSHDHAEVCARPAHDLLHGHTPRCGISQDGRARIGARRRSALHAELRDGTARPLCPGPRQTRRRNVYTNDGLRPRWRSE